VNANVWPFGSRVKKNRKVREMNFRDLIKILPQVITRESFDKVAKQIDATYNLPWPALEQHLSAPKALTRELLLASFLFAFVSGILNILIVYRLGFSFPDSFLLYAIGFIVPLLFIGIDYYKYQYPYSARARRSTYGSAHWATLPELENANLVSPNTVSPLPEKIPVGPFGKNHWLTLSLVDLFGSTVFFGKPRAGKTLTFMVNFARCMASVGGSFILDVKGEIAQYTDHYYEETYRIDFQNPDLSDSIDLIGMCAGDVTFASAIANQLTASQENNGSKDKFWDNAAADLIRCILLQLPYMKKEFPAPTPASIYNFLSSGTDLLDGTPLPTDPHGRTQAPTPDFNKLFFEQGDKPDHIHKFISDTWAIFASRLKDERVLGSVIVTLTTALAMWRNPEICRVFTPPTKAEAKNGRRVIDFKKLRQKGTAIYLVVSADQAERYGQILATIVSLLTETLIRHDEGDPVMVQLDEAGNIKIKAIAEFCGICRAKRIAPVFAFQNVAQIFKFYGHDYGDSLLGTIRTKIFLPGIDDKTAEYAAKSIGKTTTVGHRVTDGPGTANDSVQSQEVGRDLLDANEFRQMEEYLRAVVITGSAPPAKIAFPPSAALVDPYISIPQSFAEVGGYLPDPDSRADVPVHQIQYLQGAFSPNVGTPGAHLAPEHFPNATNDSRMEDLRFAHADPQLVGNSNRGGIAPETGPSAQESTHSDDVAVGSSDAPSPAPDVETHEQPTAHSMTALELPASNSPDSNGVSQNDSGLEEMNRSGVVSDQTGQASQSPTATENDVVPPTAPPSFPGIENAPQSQRLPRAGSFSVPGPTIGRNRTFTPESSADFETVEVSSSNRRPKSSSNGW
jgi:type IV secretory pathway TraG/TraD family ATPase VirD4